MQKCKLLIKFYSKQKENHEKMREIINEEIKNLDVIITSFLIDEGGFVNLTLKGEDEIAASNYLSKIYGRYNELENLKENMSVKGYICSSGEVGFGLFIDIGIKKPYAIDPLIPLYTLRKQLANDQKLSAKQIINSYSLIDNIPLEITLEKINIGLKEIDARFSENQLKKFNTWIEEGLDKLYIIGTFKEDIQRTLEKTNHDKDIISLESLGILEHIITCKFNTSAKGLIPEIGKLLTNTKLEIFSPAKIKKISKV